MRCLLFEDFAEALIRLATLIALPTDEDLTQVGAEDAGVYLIALQSHAPSQFRAFLRERRSTLTGRPRQAAWRCVDHLLLYAARLIEQNSLSEHGGSRTPLVVTLEQASDFAARRARGEELRIDAEGLGLSAQGKSSFAAALQKVREGRARSTPPRGPLMMP